MEGFDTHAYAHKLMRSTEARKDKNTTFAVPIERLRLICTDYIKLKEAKPAEEKATGPALTKRERECFEVIKSMINDLERPTVRSVATAMGYKGPNSARVIINRLVEYGLITRIGAKKQIALA